MSPPLLSVLQMGYVFALDEPVEWVVKVLQSLSNPVNCSPPGSSVHGILQARILEWVAVPFSRGSSQPRDWTQVSFIASGFLTIWATKEALMNLCWHHINNYLKSVVYIIVHIDVGHSVDLDKCVIHHYSISTTLKIICFTYLSLPPPSNLCIHGFAFFRMSYSWSPIGFNLSRLASFTK